MGLGGAVGVIAVDNYGDTAHSGWDTGPLQLWLYNVIYLKLELHPQSMGVSVNDF